MQDFATDDFRKRIVRVRPTSGVDKADNMEETKGADGMQFGKGNVELGDEEEKFNKLVKLDMEE
jgi:hypothetical protein